jgi:glycosyltransferase involved in cell wall biosynthesis
VRVAHFCDCEPARPDGVATSVGVSVALLRAAGHEVEHYRPGPLLGPGRPGDVRSIAVPFRSVRLAAPWWLPAPPDGRGPAGEPDVVHVHTTGPVGMAGFRLAGERRLPLVLTWHTDLLAYADHFLEIPVGASYCASRLRLGWTVRDHLDLADRRGPRHRRLLDLGRAFFDRTSLVVAPSAKTAADLRVFGDLPPVWVVPTPVDRPGPAAATDPRAARGLRAALDLSPGAPVVLSVGRVTPEKNPELLLRAFAEVAEARPDARLVVLGVDRGRRRVAGWIRTSGLDDRVRLLPAVPRDQVAGYYRMADVLAFASTTDTQSLVVAEAEAAGLPAVLADPALGIRADDEASHRVTCAAEPDALAAALLRMLGDPDLRERTRAAGLAAQRAYSPDRYLSLLTAAYARALAEAGRAHPS